MGLDVSHDAYHGAYSSFMRFREQLAKYAGLPPLRFMECYWDSSSMKAVRKAADDPMGIPYNPLAPTELIYGGLELPIKWECLKPDPLFVLLLHSDCEGEIEVEHLLPLAARLEEIAAKMPEELNGGGHLGNVRSKTLQFAAGCRAAHAAGEPLDFH